jgi:CubicO group peptidase (beta-lactamase class C family)
VTTFDDAQLLALARFLDDEAQADRFSGAVVIEQGGEFVFSGAYGYAHLGLGVRNQLDTRFNIASVTKLFTTVAVLQLVEQSQLSLDATHQDLLPDVTIGSSDRITVRHLLTHRSGLGDYWNDRCRERRSVLRTTDAYLELIDGSEPAFEPGTAAAYGNSGFVLLGAMVERVCGIDYYDYVRTSVCRRAGLERAAHLELDHIEDFAHGYTHIEWEGAAHPDFRTDNLFQYPVRGSAATGMYASAPELTTFGVALRAGELVSDASLRLMLPSDGDAPGFGTQLVPYSLGRAIGHGGRAFGAATCLLFLREVDLSVCILSNYDRPADKRVFEAIDRLLSPADDRG